MAPLSSVSRSLSLFAAVVVAGAGLAGSARAQTTAGTAGAEVEVRNVKFATVRPDGGGEAWLEATVELTVKADPAAGVYGRFADRVQVSLLLSVRKRDNDLAFFRASAEAVALETGRAALRFYLPPEILRREQASGDPFAYAVELAIQGRPVPSGNGGLAPTLRTDDPARAATLLRNFKDRVAQAAPLNDGVLVPQHLSPFVHMYRGDTPAVIRRDR